VIKNNLNKKFFINILNKRTGFSKNFSKKIVDDLFDVLLLNIKKKGNFTIKNIGTFKTIYKKERIGRNPKTKEEFKISSRKSISFVLSKKLIKNLNDRYEKINKDF
tara:strand:+ start:176 stop:493 length:318 start_codon:yes stop_codon:yes gene_type:complete